MAEQQVQKQHPIPQQVLGIEFKLVGDLTLRQFVILALSGGLAYALFSLPGVNPLIKIPLAGVVLLLGVAFGLVPIKEQSLDRWLAYFFRAVYSPTRRVWQKIPEPLEFLVVPIPKLIRTVEEGISPEEARKRLEEYLAAVKEKEALSPLDMAEKQQLEFINLELQETVIEARRPPVPKEAEIPKAEIPEAKPPEVEPPKVEPLKAKLPPPPPAAPPPIKPYLLRRRVEEAEKPSLASTINYAIEPVLKIQRGEKVTYVTALRNVRVGRRLSYTPTAEVVFAPARERVIEPTLPSPPTIEPVTAEPPPLPKPKVEKPAPPVPKEVKPPLPVPPGVERPAPAETPPALRPVAKLPSKVEKPPPPPKIEKPTPPKKIKPVPPPKKLEKVGLKPPPPPTGEPNSISGTVYDKKGRIVEGALVAVKDQAGMTIRATKTNQLGQFSFSPLPNGYYRVELPKARLPFAIMKTKLTGAIVPPSEIRARA